MRYFISSFFLNRGPSGGLTLEEFDTYEEALAKYDNYKNDSLRYCLKKSKEEEFEGDEDDDEGEGQESSEPNKEARDDDSEYECEVKSDGKIVYKTNYSGQNIVVKEGSDLATGKVIKQVYEDGNWKRPSGVELLCIPIAENCKSGAMYSCYVRTHPDNRDYGYY